MAPVASETSPVSAAKRVWAEIVASKPNIQIARGVNAVFIRDK
jgi:hypothetical protein